MFSIIEQELKKYKEILIKLKSYRYDDFLNTNLIQNFNNLDESEIYHDDGEGEIYHDDGEDEIYHDDGEDEIYHDDSENLNYSFNQGDFNSLSSNEEINEEIENNTFDQNLFFLDEDEYFKETANVELATIESIKKIVFDVCRIYLEGDFLENLHIENKVDNCVNFLEDLLDYAESGGSDDKFQLAVNNLLLIYVDSLKVVFQDLKNFSIRIIKNFSLDKDEHFFYIDNKYSYYKNFSDIFPDKVAFYLNLQYNILRVTIIDFFLDDNISSIKDLISIENNIDNYKKYSSNIYLSVKLKINLLKNKWLKRREESSKNKEIEYRIDDKFYILKEDKNNLFDEWLIKIDNHYEININFKNEITKEVIKYIDEDISQLSYFQLHYLIKYYKDINSNIEKLKTIMDYLLSFEYKYYNKYDEYSTYDKYCFQIIKNYAINNYFSKYSEKIINIERYIDEYYYCKRCLSNIVDNYFLDYKFLNESLVHINSKINNNSKSEDEYKEIEMFNKILKNNISPVLYEYYEKKEWAKSNSNFVFIMPKKDSTIVLNDSNKVIKKIFIASSFVLPFDIKESDKNYSKVRQKYREVKSLCGVLSNLKKDLNKLEDLSKEFDKKDLKSIEIIGLFTAIITFILSAIPAFKFVNTLNEALLFTMSMASSLGLFLTLVFISTRGIKSFRRNWLIVLCFLFFALIGLYLYYKSEKKSINSIIENFVEKKLKTESSDSIRQVIIEEFIKDYETNKNLDKQ